MVFDKIFLFVECCGVWILDVDCGYCKMVMLLVFNLNYVGIMYVGVLYIIVELFGGVIYMLLFDIWCFYLIVKDMWICFCCLVIIDVIVEVCIIDEEIECI